MLRSVMQPYPDQTNGFLRDHVDLLCRSYERLLGKPLIAGAGPDPAFELFFAECVVLSHGTEEDPVFNYVNMSGMDLFEMDWDQFMVTPSRLSAEPENREERARLMERVTNEGYIDDYSGVRIASTGHRFEIHQATVWNLVLDDGVYRGQAAVFSDWTSLPSC